MADKQIKCLWCGEAVVVNPGGWVYQRSQLMLHLASCVKRPAEGGISQLNIAADRLLDSLPES